MTKRIKIVCRKCGSDDVRRDAWAEWDTENQEWTLGTVFDQGHCEACEGESSLTEIEIPEGARAGDTVTLHGITLTEHETLPNELTISRDQGGMLRLHNGQNFRGYVASWGGDRFQVALWSGAERFRRCSYRTLNGAERQFRARARAMEG